MPFRMQVRDRWLLSTVSRRRQTRHRPPTQPWRICHRSAVIARSSEAGQNRTDLVCGSEAVPPVRRFPAQLAEHRTPVTLNRPVAIVQHRSYRRARQCRRNPSRRIRTDRWVMVSWIARKFRVLSGDRRLRQQRVQMRRRKSRGKRQQLRENDARRS